MQAAMDSMRMLCIEINLERWPGLNRSRRPSIAAEPLTVMGYTFANPDLGRAAIHLDHDRHQFERLEFLGDAIIDLMTLEQLWDANPHLGPAPLTHMKHSRVANSALAAFLVCSDLYKQTEMDAQTTEKMAQYAAAVTAKRAEVDRHAAAGKRTHEFWNLIPSHKWMGDIVEAVFGAIFEDSGFDLAVVGAVYAAHLHPFVSRYAVPPHAHSLHPKSVLLELLALRKCHEWSIERTMVEEKVAAAVVIHGIVVGSAVEAKTALAVRNACEDALTTLKDVKTCPCAHKQVDT
jgi:dsRNA-specific ribonuclease